MRRPYIPPLCLLISVMIDISVIPTLGIANIETFMPPLFAAAVIALALLLGRTQGMLWGLLAGLLTDILVSDRVGFYSMVLVAIGYLAGFAGRNYDRYMSDKTTRFYRYYFMLRILAPFGCYLVYEFAKVAYLYLAGGRIYWALFGPVAIRAAACVMITQGYYLLCNRLMQPHWARYARR